MTDFRQQTIIASVFSIVLSLTITSSSPYDAQARYEEKTGGQAIAIPHNANLSNGLMFAETSFNGQPLTREYAAARMRWGPLHEMSQIKGDEETHPLLSPDDEFADFETWDVSNLAGTAQKEESMLKYEYSRSALKLGKDIGVNPYKVGMSATIDSHTGLSTMTWQCQMAGKSIAMAASQLL